MILVNLNVAYNYNIQLVLSGVNGIFELDATVRWNFVLNMF